MLKIAANWLNHSLKFPFDKTHYAKLHTHHEKSNYASTVIQKFVTSNSNIPNLLKISISQQVQSNIEQFAAILSEYIDIIITNTNYIGYVRFLAVASTFMDSLPRVEKYSNFADLICHFCFNKENKQDQHYFVATLHFLFSQQKFCDRLIQNAQIQSLIISFLKGTSSEIMAFCEGILTPQLVISSMNNENPQKDQIRTEICAEYFIPKLFEFTISQTAQISSVYAIILFLAKLAFKICEKYQKDILELQTLQNDNEGENKDNQWLIDAYKSQNQTLIDKISQNEIFGNLNVCLKMREDATKIVGIYSYLLRCTSSIDNAPNGRFSVINVRALNRFIQLYRETTVQTKKSILLFIHQFDILYKHPFCCDCCLPNKREHFPLEKFCVDDVLTNIECFNVYSSIIEKVILLKHPEVVERSFQKILFLIKPVSSNGNNNYQYPPIFKWFSKVLLMEGISPMFFRDQSFFSDFIINSSNDSAISFIKMPDFYRVLSILLDEKRNFHRKHALFRKMIELAIFQPEIQTNLLSLLSENFGPDIFRFYLKNMEQPNIHDVLDPFLPFNTYDFRNLFKLGNCFQIVLRKIDSENFLIDLLKLIYLIVNQNNDHFFDEWVIVQPKDSPLFKLNHQSIRDYVIPSNFESPFYIPSLLPLIDDYLYEGESLFNYYLIGRFATPIYSKLRKKNPYFPKLYFYYVTSVKYIRPYSIKREEKEKFINFLKDRKKNSNFIIPCYEFFPRSSIGYLEIIDVPVTSISFNIKFNKVTNDSICFMRFSGLALIFKNGKIFIGNDSPFKVNAEQWIKVSVKSKLFSRTEISVNGTVFNVSKSFQFECLGDNNGLTFISYIIDKNITINEIEDSSSLIKLQGSAAFVPIHSISDFFDNYHNFLNVIEIYATNEKTRNISFLISLSEFIKSNNLYSFFLDVFHAILSIPDKFSNKSDNDWITTLVDYINLIDNVSTRTYLYCSLLFDIETWTKLTVFQMKTLISYSLFQFDTYKLQNEIIFTKYNFLFSIIISHYYDSQEEQNNSSKEESNRSLRELFFSLWNTVASKLPNTEIIDEIVPFAFTIKISTLDFSSGVREFNVGKVLANISLNNLEKTSIISFIFDLENEYQKPFFNLEQLLEISLTQDIEIAEKSFNKICQVCRFSNPSDVNFISKNVVVLSKVSQRFSTKQSTWTFFTEFLIKQQIENFPIQIEQVLITKIEHPEFLYILFSMLLSLSRNCINNDDSNLIELRKNSFEFINSIISSTKIDDSFIFSENSLFYIFDLITGGEHFNYENWMIKNEEELKPFFVDSIFASNFAIKLYQSIPLFAPIFTKIYDSSFQGAELNDEYFEMMTAFFQKLIVMSFRNKKHFFYILEILFNLKNIKFLQENLIYIMLFLMTSNITSEMQDLLRKFFYILSIVRPEVYTNEFVNQIFSKCIDEKYFDVLSTYISCNDNFTFKLLTVPDEKDENETIEDEKNQYEFGPFLRMLEIFGPQFVRDNLCNASFIAVKLIQKGCDDKRFNNYLNLFASNNISSTSSMNNLNSEAESNSNVAEINNQENEFKITPDLLQKFVGPTFAHLICTLHDYSKITADKPLFDNALNEFKVIYKIIKTQQIENPILNEFHVHISDQISSENEPTAETEESQPDSASSQNSNPVLSHLASAVLNNNQFSSSSIKKSIGTTTRKDQKSFAMLAIKIIAQSLVSCYNANKFFFNEFNIQLRRKEFDNSLKYFKISMLKSQQQKPLDDKDCDETEYSHENDRQQYEHKVLTKRYGKSYKISPFVSPFHIPTVVIPSSFSLKTPNNEQQKDAEINKDDENEDKTFIFLKPTVVYSVPLTNEYPANIFRFSSLYNYPKDQLLSHFEKIYGKVESMMNCILIRLDLRVDSIIMKLNPKIYIILTDAVCEFPQNSNSNNSIVNANNLFDSKGEIKLNNEINSDLCGDFLNGDYGRFSMFCGHFVLIVSVDDIQLSTPYVSLTNPNSVYVNSITSGSFIIEFVSNSNNQENAGIISTVIQASLNAVISNNIDFPSFFSSFSASSEGKKYLLSINDSKASWLAGEMSDIEYLIRVNRAAQRSFCDLSSYPIMPRLLKDFNQTEFPFVFEKMKNPSSLQSKEHRSQFSSSVPSFAPILEAEKVQNETFDNNEDKGKQSAMMKSASTPSITKKESQNESLESSDVINVENQQQPQQQQTQAQEQQQQTQPKEQQQETRPKEQQTQAQEQQQQTRPKEQQTQPQEQQQETQPKEQQQQTQPKEQQQQLAEASIESNASKSSTEASKCTILRDLQTPVQISSSNDRDLAIFRRRSEAQSYFYAENISNPIYVSGISIRLSPFCRSIWYLNDGWDKGSRNFTSIQSFFGVNKKTNYEFSPEAFIGNTFINWNKFVLPSGEPLTIKEYPCWPILHNSSHGIKNCGNFNCSNYSLEVPFKFAELQRFLIEMENTRENLNSWIDLYFGCKQNSFEDYNVFSPLSYMQQKPPENQRPWFLQCGRVPLKIFETSHDKWKPKSGTTNETVEENLNANSSSSLYASMSQTPDQSQSQISISDSISESSSSLQTMQVYQSDEVIKYVYRFDLTNIKFNHKCASYPAHQLYMSNMIQKIKLAKGYSFIINEQGITLLHTKSSFLSSSSSSKAEKIQSFDCSLVSTSCIEEVRITRDLQYLSISYFNNTVSVARIVYEGDNVPTKLRPVGQLNISELDDEETRGSSSKYTRHNAINTNHLICATGIRNRIIIWSISNGHVLWEAIFAHKKTDKNRPQENQELEQKKAKVISFPNNKNKSDEPDSALIIDAIEFDEVTDALFVAFGSTLYQMSLSGIVIREIVLGPGITTISCFGFGFSFAERVLAVGQTDGTVKIIAVNLDERNQKFPPQRKNSEGNGGFDASENFERLGEFVVSKEMKISSLPIYKIETNDFSYNVSVYDLSCRFPEFLPKLLTE